MKRLPTLMLCVIVPMLSALAVPYAAGQNTSKMAFSLVLRGGAGSMAVGDLNSVLSSRNSLNNNEREVFPDFISGNIPEASGRFKNWEAEVQWKAWKGLSVGLAFSGAVNIKSNGSVYSMAGDKDGYSVSSKVRAAVPVKLNLYYAFPLVRGTRIVMNGGIGLYHVRMSYGWDWLGYDINNDVYMTQRSSFEATGNTVGSHCGFVLEYELNGRFSILAESQWRFSKIRSMKGDGAYYEMVLDGGSRTINDTSSSGYVYHYTYGSRTFFPQEMISVITDPSTVSEDITELRKATFDLSGFSFRIGLKIELF